MSCEKPKSEPGKTATPVSSNNVLQKTFEFLPHDKILIETDSPFLAPVPNRGKKNEPSFIDFTAQKLADIKNITKSEIINLTTSNFNKLFFN